MSFIIAMVELILIEATGDFVVVVNQIRKRAGQLFVKSSSQASLKKICNSGLPL